MSMNRSRVAELAGVSPVTVSRAFRGSPTVNPETRNRIMQAARKCGYVPNAAARAIRQGRFHRVAAVVVQYGDVGTSWFPNNGFLDPAVHELAQHGYSMVLEPLHLDMRDDAFHSPPRLFSEFAVDGILGLSAGGIVPPTVDEHVSQLGAPVVWMNREPSPGLECVMSDEEANGRCLARHLIELGHERIGYITFESPNYQLRDRLKGITSELTAAGLDTSNIFVGPRGCCMVDLAEQLLDRRPRVTGAIGFHRGAYDALSHTALRRGIRVPEELSLCYFAAPWQVILSDYRPTTLEVAESAMGVMAVRRLATLMSGESSSDPMEPIKGSLHPGWTTSRPGEPWAKDVQHCRHEEGRCLYSHRVENWVGQKKE